MTSKYKSSSLKRLSHDLLQARGLFLLASLGTLLQVGLTIYLPVLIGNAVDSVLLPDASRQLLPILGQMALVIGANTLVQWFNPLLYNRLVYSYSKKLRQQVIEKIHRLPFAYLDGQGTGDVVSRLTTDLDQLNNGLLMVFNQFFVGLLTIFITIVTMAQIDIFMMLLVLLLTPLSLFIARFIARKSYSLFQQQTEARGRQTQLIEESLRQESLIQAFNAQEQFMEAFGASNSAYSDYSQAAIFYSSTVNPATRFVNALIYALIVGFGAVRIIGGSAFTVGQLVTFLNYVNQYTKPFNDISSVLSELQSALACAERLYHVLDEPEIAETGTAEVDAAQVQGHIRFEHICFGYEKDRPLIRDLTVAIPAASKVAIVGPTGAGKST
ncbi:ABC transporter ATP-binding protein, partial [Streptococcus sp. DD11]|uniref:ABC transporter ATP-binding protein n=1 Tax=Streptococcus sp. DD11 TaxID=1777879 RepID=UPI0013E31A95